LKISGVVQDQDQAKAQDLTVEKVDTMEDTSVETMVMETTIAVTVAVAKVSDVKAILKAWENLTMNLTTLKHLINMSTRLKEWKAA
jgi:hypothetical protein